MVFDFHILKLIIVSVKMDFLWLIGPKLITRVKGWLLTGGLSCTLHDAKSQRLSFHLLYYASAALVNLYKEVPGFALNQRTETSPIQSELHNYILICIYTNQSELHNLEASFA